MSKNIKKRLTGIIAALALFCATNLAMAKVCSPWTCAVQVHQD
jgi:hypothetical protein